MTEHESETSRSGSGPPEVDDSAVVAEFESFGELLELCAARICEEGIVLESAVLVEAGSTTNFDVRIRDGFQVLSGEGEVLRIDPLDVGDGDRSGITLRFLHLDQPSLKLLPRLIEHYRKRGMPLLELPAGTIPLVSSQPETAVEVELPETPTLTLQDVEEEFSEDGGSPSRMAEESEPEDVDFVEITEDRLIEAAAVGEVPEAAIEDVADEIRLDDLMKAGDSLVVTAESGEEVALEGPPEDTGLPWLPDETESAKRGDLWLILVLAVLGALLGAFFYFFYLEQPEGSGNRLLEEDTVIVSSEASHLVLERLSDFAAPSSIEAPDLPPRTAFDRSG